MTAPIVKLDSLPPAARATVEKQLKAQRDSEYPAFLESARIMCDRADAPRMEKELQKNCNNELVRRHIPFLHLSPMAREKAGWPDLTFPLRGKFIACELKKAKGVVSPEQRQTLTDMAANGAVCAVIRTFTDFLELLKKEG